MIVRPLYFQVMCEHARGRRGSATARKPIDFDVTRSVLPSGSIARGGVTPASAMSVSSSARRSARSARHELQPAANPLCSEVRRFVSGFVNKDDLGASAKAVGIAGERLSINPRPPGDSAERAAPPAAALLFHFRWGPNGVEDAA